METLSNIIKDSLDNYFNTLKYLGYVSSNKVNGLLSLIFIDELKRDFADLITPEDSIIIDNVIHCIINSNCITTRKVTIKPNLTSYLFAASKEIDPEDYPFYIPEAKVYTSDTAKGLDIQLYVPGEKQRIVFLSTEANLTFSYNRFEFPTTSIKLNNGYYAYISENTYSKQTINLTVY